MIKYNFHEVILNEIYIENIVIGTPIVSPESMFASSDDDWGTVEKEKLITQTNVFYHVFL